MARKIILGTLGITAILVGIVLLVLPGPGLLLIGLGLVLLSLEFEWARRIVDSFRNWVRQRRTRTTNREEHQR